MSSLRVAYEMRKNFETPLRCIRDLECVRSRHTVFESFVEYYEHAVGRESSMGYLAGGVHSIVNLQARHDGI